MATVKKGFRFQKEQLDYDFKLKRKFPWWILLLLLFPLLLLVRCQKDLTVECVEADTGAAVCYQDVTLAYTDHFIVKTGRWFSADSISLTQRTDSTGITVFEKLPCSVFSYVFHALQKGKLFTEDECHGATEKLFCFHYSRHIRLALEPRREDLRVRVVDAETGDPIPDAVVSYLYREQGTPRLDSVRVDAAGVATLPGMRFCGQIDSLMARSYGYYDAARAGVPCRDLLVERDSTDLRLQPVKDRFTFFVKNVETKAPIPDAVCDVVLTLPGASHRTVSRQVRTSIDGKGIAVYSDAPILSTIAIKASKVNYRDSTLADGPKGPWQVAEFIRQDDDTRTVWLKPVPFLQEFVNLDSLTLKPIPGVKNEITVTHPDGTRTTMTETSNRNGVFPITAREDDLVEVVSTKGGEYLAKHTRYPKFKDIDDKRILMQPDMETFTFRTVHADDHSSPVPDCSLKVTGTISGALPPSSSGDGTFSVTMRKVEKLSIVASKPKYKTNSSKVYNRDAAYLSGPQDRRDIPMEWDLPPCNGGVQEGYDGTGITTKSYSLGQMSGSAVIWVDFMSIGDYLTVYDGTSASGVPIIDRTFIKYERTIPFSFTKGAITVVVESSSKGYFEVRCP